ncbi:MAG: NAD-dependent protein deacylase [Rhodospirillales bacterium]|nr:NAD-dependent protein deacylase [Rhodospirillales bacterium]
MKRIVILTGAGISKESGLDTFRDKDGIWSKVRLEDVATPEGFEADPKRVQAFYNVRRRQLQDPSIRPNPAHEALAHLERQGGHEILIVTQNIDDLHERAGSRNLIHMHGEMLKARCLMCGSALTWTEDIEIHTPCPACAREGGLRPHVVWFGEMPLEVDRIYAELSRADLFLSIGTSGNVYPAAGFVAHVRGFGRAHTVELNLEPSEGTSHFAERIHGLASRIVPDFIARLLSEP